MGRLEELAKAPLGRLLVRYSWPALVSMSLNALYTVVDRFYVGQGCGADAMAGLTLAMPVMMAFGAFGVFVGAGHSAVLSIKLGEGDRVTAEKALGELVAVKLLFFLVLPPLVFFNLDTVLFWCGGDKVTPGAFAAARTYLQLVVFSHLFSHLAFGFSAMMRAEGAAVRSMMCLVVGFGVNFILDPVLIFGCGMGIAGAAWATNVAMFVSALWALAYYARGRSVVRLRPGRIRIYGTLFRRTAAIGLSPFLQQISAAFINFALVAAFTKWAADDAAATRQIASLGVFQSALILVFMPILGVQQGLAPIMGYNWGARNFARVRRTLLLGFGVTSVLCFIAFAVQVIPPFPQLLAAGFFPAGEAALRALAAKDLALSNCMIWCIGINVVSTTYFQSIGRAGTATLLTALRQIGIMLPCIWILPHFMADHTFAIWLSMPVSDVLANLATIPPFVTHVRFLGRIRCRSAESYAASLTGYLKTSRPADVSQEP